MPFILGIEAVKEHEKVIPIAHLDRSITRPKLEYPTVNVNFAYLSSINKTKEMPGWEEVEHRRPLLITTDIFINKAVETLSKGDCSHIIARAQSRRTLYTIYQASWWPTHDFILAKIVTGTWTVLGAEAVDLKTNASFRIKIRCIGTIHEGYRVDMVIPKISATDTNFASGWFGFAQETEKVGYLLPEWVYLRGSPANPPRTIAYFEAPIIGSGIEDDPFRAKLPEKIIEDKTHGKRNLFSVSHSSLIPTDAKGQPRNTTALIRVFAQPDRDSALAPIDTCLKEIEASTGIKKLIRTDAIKRVKGMDPKLTDYDLLSHPRPTKGDIEDLIKHKRKIFGIKLTEKEAIEELKYDKAW